MQKRPDGTGAEADLPSKLEKSAICMCFFLAENGYYKRQQRRMSNPISLIYVPPAHT